MTRRRARIALLSGDLDIALDLAHEAEGLCGTEAGKRLAKIAEWLEEIRTEDE